MQPPRHVADDGDMARTSGKKKVAKKARAKLENSPASDAAKTTPARRRGLKAAAAAKISPSSTSLAPAVETVPLAKINPAPYNPSRPIQPGEPGFERLKKAIETFGAVQLLVWNQRTGHLVGGHQTLTVLRAIDPKLQAVTCSVVDLPEDLEKALNLRLNRRATDDDPVRLGELLQQVIDADVDDQLTGLDEAGINAAMQAMQAELDAAPPPLPPDDGDGEDEDGPPTEPEAEEETRLASFYQVVAECDDENHQRALYEQLRRSGVQCRLLTLY